MLVSFCRNAPTERGGYIAHEARVSCLIHTQSSGCLTRQMSGKNDEAPAFAKATARQANDE